MSDNIFMFLAAFEAFVVGFPAKILLATHAGREPSAWQTSVLSLTQLPVSTNKEKLLLHYPAILLVPIGYKKLTLYQ